MTLSSNRSVVPRSGLTRTRSPMTEDEKKTVRDKDHKMVKGIFRCYEPVGGTVDFFFKKHKGDQILRYKLFDGEIVDLPLMVARHINKNCAYRQHKYAMDANGVPIVDKHSRRRQRFAFESLEFQMEEAS